jgi:DNA mismatch repair protein MutL
MPNLINLLPEAIANQIAAGEVVQRPASVVKELLENSVDAKATSISLIVKDAGRTLIQVVDNGSGMNPSDAIMCFARHATSKIKQAEDLFKIKTMGFRGEAMASIAAVAQVELRTRQTGEEIGTLVIIDGSEIKKSEPVATAEGTSIAVKNLFFNVPARRNFLKSNSVELRHIMDEFNRVVLANPQIGFSLVINDVLTIKLAPGKLATRIVELFGNNYKEQLATTQEQTDFMNVIGYVGKPGFAKKLRGEQYFFVNNRYVKNYQLHSAIFGAFEGLLAPETHPFYVLFIELDPVHIDINVHPTKTEIKFDDERTVYAIIRAAVRKTLSAYNLLPSIDFEQAAFINDITGGSGGNFPGSFEVNTPSQKTSGASAQNWGKQTHPFDANREAHNLKNWGKLYNPLARNEAIDEFQQISGSDFSTSNFQNQSAQQLTFGSAINERSSTDLPSLDTDKQVFQVQQRYILTPVKSGLMMIDQNAAHQRIIYERLVKTLGTSKGGSQQLLFPKTVNLSLADYSLAMELQEDFAKHDFVFEPFGGNTIKLSGLPADIPSGEEHVVFEDLLSQLKEERADTKLNYREAIAKTFAKRTAIKWGKQMTKEEMSETIDRLFACEIPHYTPEGLPTLVLLNAERLASFF